MLSTASGDAACHPIKGYPTRISAVPDRAATTPADVASRAVAHEIGFEQCISALRRVLLTTPIGWALVSWFAWWRSPHVEIFIWLGGFFASWLAGLLILRSVAREGPALARHTHRFLAIVVMDGACWGAVGWLLVGYSETLDVWLIAVLCGVAAVNAPIYITWFRAYAVLLGTIWITVMAAAALRPGHPLGVEIVVGMTIFCVLLIIHMRSIAQRVFEGICLQLRNATLADQLRDALQSVRQDAETDALTGQPNRRALDTMLGQQLALARTSGRSFCVLLLDIDHFKLVNDTHGHGAGDDTLRAFARRVLEHLRQNDICARYGGEEFVVVLPGTVLSAAREVAERLRRGVAEAPLMSLPLVRATVSIGIAQYVEGETAAELLARADAGVYAAKHNGRNQVCVTEAVLTA